MTKALTVLRVAVVLLVCVAVSCSANEMGPKTKLPDDSLFQDSAAFCEGCYGMVHELEKLLTKWQKEKGSMEDHIDAALHAVCSTDRLRAYVLSPPKMMRLCSGIRAHYMEELAMAVLRHYTRTESRTVDQLFTDICRKAIPACLKGVTPMSVTRQENRRKADEEREKKEAKSQTSEDTKEVPSQKQDGAKRKPATEKKKDEL